MGLRRRHVRDRSQKNSFPTGTALQDETKSCHSLDLESSLCHELNSNKEGAQLRQIPSDSALNERLEMLARQAQRMRSSVEELKAIDEFSRKHNQRMMKRELLLCGLGLIFLVCPALIVFTLLVDLLPRNHVEIMRYASHQNDFVGAASRFCLQIASTAHHVRDANSQSGCSYLWGCCGALIILLLLIRGTVTKHEVLTPYHREQIKKVENLIK